MDYENHLDSINPFTNATEGDKPEDEFVDDDEPVLDEVLLEE